MDNPYLSLKTKGCVLSVLSQYETMKSKTCSKEGQGVPRGISISAILSEIYMREFDIEVKRQPNVIFYARYVDDIFILYSDLLPSSSLDDMWLELATKDSLGQMELHWPDSTKTSLVKYAPKQQGIRNEEITYLGYTIKISSAGKNISLSLSQKRYNRIKGRIDNAFSHFEDSYKFDLRQAHKTLIDCLNLLSGNVSLRKSKCGLKTGLYYSNDLLTDLSQLKDLTSYLHRKAEALDVEMGCLGSEERKATYLNRIKNEVKRVDFGQRWKERKTYSFRISEMRRLSKVLNNEKKA
jgi:hypothetical protein